MPTAIASPWPSGPVVRLDPRPARNSRDGRRTGCRAGGSSGCRRSSAARSRSGGAARRSASSHGPPTARSGRGRAIWGRPDRYFRCRVNKAVAASAMPIGMPGWPLLAASTASIARARMALASRRWVGCMRISMDGVGRATGLGWPMGWCLWAVSAFGVNLASPLARATSSCYALGTMDDGGLSHKPWSAPSARLRDRARARAQRRCRRAARTSSFAPRCATRRRARPIDPDGGSLPMAEVDLTIAGRTYQRRLPRRRRREPAQRRGAGRRQEPRGAGRARHPVRIAPITVRRRCCSPTRLLDKPRGRRAPAPDRPELSSSGSQRLAERLESLADALEQDGQRRLNRRRRVLPGTSHEHP